jgi:hypothetical protein
MLQNLACEHTQHASDLFAVARRAMRTPSTVARGRRRVKSYMSRGGLELFLKFFLAPVANAHLTHPGFHIKQARSAT